MNLIKMEMTKKFKIIFIALRSMLLFWVFISWLNIIFNNSLPSEISNQWDWNFFRILTNLEA